MTEQLAPKTEATLLTLSADATGCSRDLSTFLPLSIPHHLQLCSVSHLFPVWSGSRLLLNFEAFVSAATFSFR